VDQTAAVRAGRIASTGVALAERTAAASDPAAGPSSRRTTSVVTRGAGRIGLSTTDVVAGLNAEPNAVVRGIPPLSSEEASATSNASHSAASRTGRVAPRPRGIARVFTSLI